LRPLEIFRDLYRRDPNEQRQHEIPDRDSTKQPQREQCQQHGERCRKGSPHCLHQAVIHDVLERLSKVAD